MIDSSYAKLGNYSTGEDVQARVLTYDGVASLSVDITDFSGLLFSTLKVYIELRTLFPAFSVPLSTIQIATYLDTFFRVSFSQLLVHSISSYDVLKLWGKSFRLSLTSL